MVVLTSSPALREPRYQEANIIPFPGDYRKEDLGWSPSGRRNILARELPEITHDRHIALSFLAYRTNPMAHRLIEMQVNFVLGNGMSVSSSNPDVLTAIGAWWNDPYNNWPMRIHQRLRDLYIYGEWLHYPLVNEGTGFTFIRDIQPDVISAAFPDLNDHGLVDYIVFKNIIMPNGEQTQKQIRADVLRKRLNTVTATLDDAYTGQVFLFGINRTSDTMRGIGELFPLLDYIDIYDDAIFSRAEKIRNMSHIYYDLQIEGKTEQEIREYLKRETNLPPRPGTVYAHNPQAILEMRAPDLRADDHAQDMAVIKSHIVASAGWPGTWFDDPGTAGRAVGAEMAEPALKGITNLQAYAELLLRYEIDYMLDQMRVAKSPGVEIPDAKDTKYTITFSRPSSRDLPKVAPAMYRLAQAIDLMVTKDNLLLPEEGRAILVSQIKQMALSDAEIEMELPTELDKITDPKAVLQRQQDAERAKVAQKANPTGGQQTKDKLAASGALITIPASIQLFRGS